MIYCFKDKESFGSNTSHAEKAFFFFKEKKHSLNEVSLFSSEDLPFVRR
ncbi:hypothetical protein [Virgibacillus proomii]|nr:hypothetical protein [Virgibacillus proomii]MBU5265760.1 hypothetical protein [Virgibacillus proomii]